MKIIPMLIPISNKFTRPCIAMTPKYITIHETDNATRGANALAHAKLQQNGNSRQASWHFTVDSGDTIYQSLPTNEVAFHAGDGGGAGNLSSIAIEICVNEDGNFEKAKENAVWLVRYLMDKHNIPLSNIVPHKHWSGKNCPRNILSSGWEKFVSKINSNSTSIPVEASNYPGKVIAFGDRGKDVGKIQKQLGGLVVDNIFGKLTDARVKEFQKAHHIAVDGIVGPITWKALFE